MAKKKKKEGRKRIHGKGRRKRVKERVMRIKENKEEKVETEEKNKIDR